MNPIYFLKEINWQNSLSYETTLDDYAKVSGYSYSYTYQYPWVKKPVNILLNHDLKENESLKLLEDELQIRKENKLHVFDIREVKLLKLEFKYLIIPLIVGGIVLSLSLLGIFSAVVERWAGMLLVTIGIILLYFGIKGTFQVSVITFSHTFSFFLEEKDEGLETFIKDFNNLRRTLITNQKRNKLF